MLLVENQDRFEASLLQAAWNQMSMGHEWERIDHSLFSSQELVSYLPQTFSWYYELVKKIRCIMYKLESIYLYVDHKAYVMIRMKTYLETRHFICDTSQSPNIRFIIICFSFTHLWTNVIWSSWKKLSCNLSWTTKNKVKRWNDNMFV